MNNRINDNLRNYKTVKNCIYCARFNNNKIYIGQALNIVDRIYQHRFRAKSPKYNTKNKFYCAWKSLGEPDFYIVETEIDSSLISDREMYWIQHYKAFEPAFGYNMTNGGIGSRGRSVSSATRALISKANKGKPASIFSQEVRDRLRESAKLRVLSADGLERLRLAHLGKKQDEVSIRKSVIGRSKPIQRSDGTIYLNMVDAAKELGSHPVCINRVLNGQFKQHKGYSFAYVVDEKTIEAIKEKELLSLETQTDSISTEIKEEDKHEFKQINDNIGTKQRQDQEKLD